MRVGAEVTAVDYQGVEEGFDLQPHNQHKTQAAYPCTFTLINEGEIMNK